MKTLGAPGAVHPDPSQGADERAPTVNGPHLSVRLKQGRHWPAGSRRRREPPRPSASPALVQAWVEIRVDLAFLNRDFQKRIKEMIYRFCLKALEIYNLLKMAPNLLK